MKYLVENWRNHNSQFLWLFILRMSSEPAVKRRAMQVSRSSGREKRAKVMCLVDGCKSERDVYLFCAKHKEAPVCSVEYCYQTNSALLTEITLPGILVRSVYRCEKHRIPPPPVKIEPADFAALLTWASNHFEEVRPRLSQPP
jgi:hypothetical protein